MCRCLSKLFGGSATTSQPPRFRIHTRASTYREERCKKKRYIHMRNGKLHTHPHTNILLCRLSDKRRHQTHAKKRDFISTSSGKHSRALKGSSSQTACVSTVNKICWLAACVAAVLQPRLAAISSNLDNSSFFCTLRGLVAVALAEDEHSQMSGRHWMKRI